MAVFVGGEGVTVGGTEVVVGGGGVAVAGIEVVALGNDVEGFAGNVICGLEGGAVVVARMNVDAANPSPRVDAPASGVETTFVDSDSASFAVAFGVEIPVTVAGTMVVSAETPLAAPRNGMGSPGNASTPVIRATMTKTSSRSTIKAAHRTRPTDSVRSRIGRE